MDEHAGADVLMDVGGAAEGVLAACAARCVGGDIRGHDPDQVLTLDDLCRADSVFVAATGVTDGELLEGVRYFSTGAVTQ